MSADGGTGPGCDIKLKDIPELIIAMIVLFIVLAQPIALIGGMLKGGDYDCKHWPQTRMGYITPTYKLGCFLTEPLNKNREDK